MKDFFFIPHHSNYIVYAPKQGLISLVNSAAAKELNLLPIIQNSISTEPQTSAFDINTVFPFDNKPFKNITFILTSDCTMNCIYCYARGGEKQKTLSLATIVGVIENAIKTFPKNTDERINISFHGGDISVVWSFFKEALHTIKQILTKNNINFSISVGINGVLTKSQQKFIAENTHSATISIDGFGEIQNFHRPLKNGKNSFEKVNNSLKSFDDLNYNYSLRTTVTDKSVHQLSEIVEYFCKNYKARKIMLEPMFQMGRGIELMPPEPVAFIDNFRKAHKIAKIYQRSLIYSGARLNTLTPIFCKALDNSIVITPEDLISCCYEVTSPDMPFADNFIYGNYDKSSKELVFDKEKRKNLMTLTNEIRQECEDCFCKYHCAGDCPVKKIYLKLNTNFVEYDRCMINRELTKDQLLEALNNEQ